MISKDKLVVLVLGGILVATNISTAYMFYSRKSSILNKEKKQIMNLEFRIQKLQDQRNEYAKKIVNLELHIDSLEDEKLETINMYRDNVDAIQIMGSEQRDTLFIKHLERISKADNYIRPE